MSRLDVESIILAEDRTWEALRPLTWLRPVGALLVGAGSNAERWRQATGVAPWILCRPFVAPLHQRWLDRAPSDRALRLWVRDSLVPDPQWAREAVADSGTAAWSFEGEIVAVRTEKPAPEGRIPEDGRILDSLAKDAPVTPLRSGHLISELSDLVRVSESVLEKELESAVASDDPRGGYGDAATYSPERIRCDPDCRLDHGAVLDAREGPIVLGAGTRVFPHTWIRGPFGCRENCLLLGGRIGGGSYLGSECRVRGEVEASTLQGFVNKAHDGFVGHSFIGEWVNLGAMTTTSDLKNNYGNVRLDAYGRTVDSRQRKIGAFIGDHAKTRIGAMLNTGSVIGVASNLFGDVTVFPKWIPDFAWGVGRSAAEYQLDRCLETVETVLSRRGKSVSQEVLDALRVVFERTRGDRARFLSGGR